MPKAEDKIADKLTEIYAVKKFVRHLHKNLKGSAKASHMLVGSAYMLTNLMSSPPEIAEHLEEIDMDFHFDSNQFTIENFICELKVRAKTKEELEKGGYRIGAHLRHFYESSVPELLETDAAKAALKAMKADSWDRNYIDTLKKSKMQLDFGFVSDVQISEEIWIRIPSSLFFTSLWKHGKGYLGKPQVRELFTTFESLARKVVEGQKYYEEQRKAPKHVLEEAAQPVWGAEPAWEVVEEVGRDVNFNRVGPAF